MAPSHFSQMHLFSGTDLARGKADSLLQCWLARFHNLQMADGSTQDLLSISKCILRSNRERHIHMKKLIIQESKWLISNKSWKIKQMICVFKRRYYFQVGQTRNITFIFQTFISSQDLLPELQSQTPYFLLIKVSYIHLKVTIIF